MQYNNLKINITNCQQYNYFINKLEPVVSKNVMVTARDGHFRI